MGQDTGAAVPGREGYQRRAAAGPGLATGRATDTLGIPRCQGEVSL